MLARLRLGGLTSVIKFESNESRSWPRSTVTLLSYKQGRTRYCITAAGKAPDDTDAKSNSSSILISDDDNDNNNNSNDVGTWVASFFNSEESSAILSASLVGLLTGVSVVLFNYLVHELRDFCWDGIPYQGASWLREKPIETTWQRTIFVPVCGGIVVSMLNALRDSLDTPARADFLPKLKGAVQQFLKSLAACITLGTGNSLGPEGPSVEIGSSIAKGVASFFDRDIKRKVALVAAGSAAGIASGFNAAVAGCFFAVESVLWPSPESSVSLTNTTSMVILSAVIASVISEVGLGVEPAFKVPDYDFRSLTELPLYLLLGILCGVVSLALTRCTTFMLHTAENIQKGGVVPKAVFPIAGSLAVGLMALAYPEILYRGFQNVDILLESRPFVKGLSGDLLFQLVGIKIIATSICRASGLVGGYYAPSLFIGAATGMSYGKFIAFAVAQSHPYFQIAFLDVASPQAYGLVGMAATLAGVCQVPLTSVLLLFELTQDYRIVIPLLGAVGMSSWITSSTVKRGVGENSKKSNASGTSEQTSSDDICEIESSRCSDDANSETEEFERSIFVSQAMRTSFATVLRGTLLVETVTLMLAEKQSYALIVDEDNYLTGMLSVGDILEFSKSEQAKKMKIEGFSVADLCSANAKNCEVVWTATPSMDVLYAESMMVKYGLNQLPVVSRHLDHAQSYRLRPVGVIDMQCIKLACSAIATKENLKGNFK